MGTHFFLHRCRNGSGASVHWPPSKSEALGDMLGYIYIQGPCRLPTSSCTILRSCFSSGGYLFSRAYTGYLPSTLLKCGDVEQISFRLTCLPDYDMQVRKSFSIWLFELHIPCVSFFFVWVYGQIRDYPMLDLTYVVVMCYRVRYGGTL